MPTQKTLTVRTVVKDVDMFYCLCDMPVIGIVVIGSGSSEYAAQNQTKKFLNTNYPEYLVEFTGGYHGGDTSSNTGNLLGHYHDGVKW